MLVTIPKGKAIKHMNEFKSSSLLMVFQKKVISFLKIYLGINNSVYSKRKIPTLKNRGTRTVTVI